MASSHVNCLENILTHFYWRWKVPKSFTGRWVLHQLNCSQPTISVVVVASIATICREALAALIDDFRFFLRRESENFTLIVTHFRLFTSGQTCPRPKTMQFFELLSQTLSRSGSRVAFCLLKHLHMYLCMYVCMIMKWIKKILLKWMDIRNVINCLLPLCVDQSAL